MKNILVCSYDEALLPERKTPEAMCRDIKAAENFSILPWEVKIVKSWIKTFIPTGWCCKLYARSSLPTKNGLMLANSTALIDSDYRGEYLMQLYNYTDKIIEIPQHTRLCQLEFAPHHWGKNNFWSSEIPEIEFQVDAEKYEDFAELYPSERGIGGLGSTGNK